MTETPRTALREGLGRYPPRRGRTFPPLALTLHDLGELLRRAAYEIGFHTEREWMVAGGKIDWVWFAPDDDRVPVLAVEIEGPAAPEASLVADARKFAACNADLRILALFTISHDFTFKPNPSRRRTAEESIREFVTDPQIRIMFDADLMSLGGIERLQREACEAVSRRRR